MHQTDTNLEFDWSLEPKALRNLYKSTDFDSQFFKLINKNVIKILAPQKIDELHNLTYDEDLIYERLICPLEKFICGLGENSTRDDVQRALDSILALNQPSKLCRRILKNGDVTFACNDCGLDATCVVCIDCFHKGAHKDHNYKMSNSDGGGCCDCGDTEAWKQNYACTDHMAPDQPNLTLADFEDSQLRAKHIQNDKRRILDTINRLPPGIANRYFMACQASLHYARMLISWDNNRHLPKCLEIEGDDDPELAEFLANDDTSTNYFTVLYNDEVHTYDFVIGTLVKIIRCTRLTASLMASTVSREGRCLLINDDYAACKQVREFIANVRDSGQNSEALKVEVTHGTILAHQAFSFRLLEWVRKMTTLCDSFRILTAYTLLGTYEPIALMERVSNSDMTLIEKIMLSNTIYWKIARVEWNDLFVKAMLTDYSIKEQFARLLTRLYPKLMTDFMRDDHDPSVSILSMTTQLYTVPSLACMLIEEENALTVIYQTFSNACNNARRENLPVNFENRKTFDMLLLKRGFHALMDVKYLLGMRPTKWTKQLRLNVVEAVEIVVELLTSLQGMDSVRRQLGNHLEYEPDWESGMSIQSRLCSNITRLIEYCGYDEQVLLTILKRAQFRLLRNTGGYKMAARELFGHRVNCIQYDVSTSPVSVHLPLSRFVVALINELMQRRPCDKTKLGEPYDESLVILEQDEDELEMKHSIIDIMEPSLRTCVMVAQFRSGMWRRNGYSLINQINFYHSPPLRKEMFGRDILALQEGAAMCEANQFMIHLLNKFQLFTWISSETTREPLVGRKAVSFQNDEEIIAHTMSLGEEFLQLVLTIVGERYRLGVGRIEESDVLKNEIIQMLCICPSTRSDLTHKLSVYNDNELDCIKSIANLKRTTESTTGKYELKDEFYNRFNPFFYHYIRRDQSNALDAQLKRKRNLGESLICCPPPKPAELTQQYSNLNQILKCDILLVLIQKVLNRAIGKPDSSLECSTKAPIRFNASDLQLDQCLHLIGLGLYEQERNPTEFDYLRAAHEKEIFTTLKGVYEDAKRSKDLIFWLMRKSNDLIDRLRVDCGGHAIADDPTKTEPSSPPSESSDSSSYLDAIREVLGSVLSISDTSKQEGKKRNSELAAQRRERIMAMMKMNQDKFLSNPSTKQLVAETEKNQAKPSPAAAAAAAATVAHSSGSTVLKTRRNTSSGQPGPRLKIKSISGKSTTSLGEQTAGATRRDDIQMDNADSDTQMDCASSHTDEEEDEAAAAADDHEAQVEPTHMCILCRDEQRIAFEQPTMVLLAYIQRSTVLSKSRGTRRIPYYALTPSNQLKFQASPLQRGNSPDAYSFTSDNSWSFDATFMPSDLFFGPHISTCGHVMHYDCWKGFFNAIMKRETSRPNRSARPISFELHKQEILCPLCECISNATIPLLPNYTRFASRRGSACPASRPQQQQRQQPHRSVFASSPATVDASAENLSSCLRALRNTVDAFKHVRHLKEAAPGKIFTVGHDDEKYIRLLQPNNINDVLEGLNETDALGLRDFINTVRTNRITSNICNTSLLSSISLLADRIHTVGLDLDRSITDVNHGRKFMMISWSIAYTIQAAERAARFKGSPLFEELQSSSSLCLSSLLRFACGSTMALQQDMIQSYLVEKLRYLLINEEHSKSSLCCLDIDAFEMFVSISIVLQKLYTHIEDSSSSSSSSHPDGGSTSSVNKSSSPADAQAQAANISGSSTASIHSPAKADSANYYGWTTQACDHEYFRNLLHLTLILNMLQVIVSVQNEFTATSKTNEKGGSPAEAETEGHDQHQQQQQQQPPDSARSAVETGEQSSKLECSALASFYKEIIFASGHSNSSMPKVDVNFVVKVRARLLPFLRSCAILFYHLSQVQPPQVLRTKSASFEGKDFVEPPPAAQQQQQQSSVSASEAQASPMSVDSTSAMLVDDEDDGDNNSGGGGGQQRQQLEAIDTEFDAICRYLDLPNQFSILLKSQEVRHLAKAWLRHPRVLILIKSAIGEQQQRRQQEAAKQCAQQQQRPLAKSSSGPRASGSSCSALAAAASSSSTQLLRQSQTNLPKSELAPVKFIAQPHLVNRLIELPHDYSELVDRVSNFSCPSIKNEDSRTPTMCLVCGVMLCSQNYCCQRDLNDLASNYQEVLQRCQQQQQQQQSGSSLRGLSSGGGGGGSSGAAAAAAAAAEGRSAAHGLAGHIERGATAAAAAAAAALLPFGASPQEISDYPMFAEALANLTSPSAIPQQLVGSCTYHAYECSGGVGIFLRIRNCQILLLSGRTKGCYMPAPYIDDHGEFDFGMIRGNPMFLNRRHYENFQHMWLTHAIPRHISRTLEYSSYASSINWHLH